MATYYWVGGNGTWDNASTTNWAASSGGAGNSFANAKISNFGFTGTNLATGITVLASSGSTVTIHSFSLVLEP